MGGWKTWSGVIGAAVTSLALFLGLDLTADQIAGIQTLILGMIGWGLGHKADKNKQATDVVGEETEAVARQVARVQQAVKPDDNITVLGK